ncbi:HAD family hydrolase [Paracoccus nototheniae]|uniref:phosphoglycolate phosphatase n=1 Tax=Paracoccus nototheniae TaxID=2489002 RepID=A0ABW4E1L6_9RHOB|nr:HAD family hydrolase [Paracoccus nototheniae]
MRREVFGVPGGAVRAHLPDLGRYRLVVFDLDGTLYHQGPVRRGMLTELLLSRPMVGEPDRLQRLSILHQFRRLREEMARDACIGFDTRLFSRLSDQTGQNETILRRLVKDWMEDRPLRRLLAARVAGAPQLFSGLRAQGTQIAVWSDYPVEHKLAVLGLKADHVISALDPDIAALKPAPAGLNRLLERTAIPPSAVLMVGDRDSHDGAAARAVNVDFLLRARKGPAGIPRIKDFRGLAAQVAQGPA